MLVRWAKQGVAITDEYYMGIRRQAITYLGVAITDGHYMGIGAWP